MTKNLIYILLCLPLSLSAISSLIFEFPGQQEIIVVMDGQPYKVEGNLQIPYIASGKHNVAVLRYNALKVGTSVTILSDEQIMVPDKMQLVYRLNVGEARLQLVDSYTLANAATNQPYTSGGYTGLQIDSHPRQSVMDPTNYTKFLAELKKQAYDDRKVEFTETYLSDSWITAEQAAGIIKMLSYDDNKLTLAQILYDRVIDPGNYFVVNKSFSFASTGEKMRAYIRDQD
jgi:Domain of unknown function (DUF4476)